MPCLAVVCAFLLASAAAADESCPPGTHTSNGSGGKRCVPCAKGMHQPRAGQSACLFCAAGQYAPVARRTACTACGAGTYAPSIGAHGCAACTSGRYASARGATSCATCPTGEFSAPAGAPRDGCTACTARPCAPGHVNALCGTRARTDGGGLVSSAGTCVVCPAGRFSPYGRGRRCTKAATCASGQWEQRAPTASSDRVCTSHRVCGAHEYQTAAPSAGADRRCAPRTRCAAGHFVATPATPTSDNVCAPCPAGTHQPDGASLATACTPCPALYRPNPGATACWAARCSHVRCVHEEHHCGAGRPTATQHAYFGLFADAGTTNCDRNGGDGAVTPRKWTSVRVTHGGTHACEGPGCHGELLEGPCRAGHHCGMGVVSGDRKLCECAPLAVVQATRP